MLIKGGKYLEALATAKNFVFDKTGTLTTGKLRVAKTVSLSDFSEDEILSLAAAVEEYSSHPIARAICREANAADITLSNFSETAGRGTSAQYEGSMLCCGSYSGEVPSNAADCNVFLTLGGELIGAVKVADTVRDESAEVISQLKSLGAQNTVMLTGDSEAAAKSVAAEVGVDSCRARLLPADKLSAVKSLDGGVCFVGDGINDAPVYALSATVSTTRLYLQRATAVWRWVWAARQRLRRLTLCFPQVLSMRFRRRSEPRAGRCALSAQISYLHSR